MYIVLPARVDGLEELVRRIDSSSFNGVKNFMAEVKVKVVLPKIRFTNTNKLKENLQKVSDSACTPPDPNTFNIYSWCIALQLGIRDVFGNYASLEGRKVSNIIQSSGIEINEKGSTASAVTKINPIQPNSASDFEFIADRPFLFLIEDESTGTLIFSGKVTYPKYQFWILRKYSDLSKKAPVEQFNLKTHHSNDIDLHYTIWHQHCLIPTYHASK